MNKVFRHIAPVIALVLAVLAGAWLTLPRDVCLSKTVANSGCVCAVAADGTPDCTCCSEKSARGKISCCESDAETNAPENTPVEHSSFCFSVSSDLSLVTNPERAPDVAPLLNVVALLPLPLIDTVDSRWDLLTAERHVPLVDLTESYRKNCVFLI